jgi:hypothetical protein
MVNLLPENNFRKAVRKALQQVTQSGVDSALAGSRLALQVQKTVRVNPRQAAQEVLEQGVARLADGDKTQAELLRLRYFEGRTITSLTAQFSRSEATLYREQRQAVQRLTNLLWPLEIDARERHLISQYGRLESPTYTRLFGIEDSLSKIQEQVQQPSPPWLVLLQGMGGLGKTALADAFLRRNMEQGWYDEIAWISARQKGFRLHGRIVAADAPTLSHEALVEALAQQILVDIPLPSPFSVDKVLPLLISRLQNTPHLLVVDNLETVVDVAALLPTLRRLVNPSKVILTSRVHLSSEPDIFSMAVPQLSSGSAFELIRSEGEMHNAPWLAEAEDGALEPIYQTVGGNPLALRLVAGQAIVHALPTVLGNLRSARGRSAEQLYSFIYREAWDDLDEEAQRILLVMPLAPASGASLEHLVQVSGLHEDAVHNALENLVRRSLVDVRGDLYRHRYTIHSLTRTFLLEQVAKWR